ncbi:hypothetical protein ACFE04_003636 [Oxalis oulophora]
MSSSYYLSSSNGGEYKDFVYDNSYPNPKTCVCKSMMTLQISCRPRSYGRRFFSCPNTWDGVGGCGYFLWFDPPDELITENEKLKKQLNKLTNESVKLRMLLQGNIRLQKYGFYLSTEYIDEADVFVDESFTSPPTIPPFFRCVLTREQASGSFPFNLELVDIYVIAILRTSSRSEYHCEIYKYQHGLGTDIYIGTGWHIFTVLENLREGDILNFHLSVSGIFPFFNVEVSRPQRDI